MKRPLLKLIYLISFILLSSLNLYSQWTQDTVLFLKSIFCFANIDSVIFAGGYGLFRSSDNGNIWSKSYKGLENSSINSLLSVSSNLYAGTNNGIYVSTDQGSNWSALNNGLTNDNVLSLVFNNSRLYAGTKDGLFISDDLGLNWHKTSDDRIQFNALIVDDNIIFAGDFYRGVFYSYDFGASWENIGLIYEQVSSLAYDGMHLFAGTRQTGIYLLNDLGLDWIKVNNGLKNLCVLSVIFNGSDIFAGTYDGVYKSSDFGENWLNVGISNFPVLSLFSISDTSEFLLEGTVGIYRSSKKSWYWTTSTSRFGSINSLAIKDSLILASLGDGIKRSTDKGITWSYEDKLEGKDIRALIIGTDSLKSIYAGSWGFGIYRSTDGGISWFNSNNGLNDRLVTSFTFLDSLFIAGTNDGIYISTDYGANWNESSEGLSNKNVVSLVVNYGTIYAGTKEGVYTSFDKGKKWNYLSLSDKEIITLLIDPFTFPGSLLAGTKDGLYHPPHSPFINYWHGIGGFTKDNITSLVIDNKNNRVLASTRGGGIYKLSDTSIYYEDWHYNHRDIKAKYFSEGISTNYVNTLAMGDSEIYAGTNLGFWRRPIIDKYISVEEEGNILHSNELPLKISPNPVSSSSVISYNVHSYSFVKISICNIFGNEVKTIINEYQTEGNKEANYDASSLTDGIYFIKLQAGSEQRVEKFIKLK